MNKKYLNIAAKHPDLNSNGFRTPTVTDDDHAVMRDRLISSQGSQVDAALRFLDGAVLRKSVGRSGSYWLKHLCERHQRTYVSPGAMVLALIIAGVPIKRHERSPNVQFALSERWLASKLMECGTRRR